jgi:hypothetical protein
VVLNIGGDIGAAIVRTSPMLAGSEIEIRRTGARWEGRHTAVRERRLPDGATHAALFDALASGHYEIRVRDDSTSPLVSLDVVGGKVVEAVLDPPASRTPRPGPG